jgi:hypothetical protein
MSKTNLASRAGTSSGNSEGSTFMLFRRQSRKTEDHFDSFFWDPAAGQNQPAGIDIIRLMRRFIGTSSLESVQKYIGCVPLLLKDLEYQTEKQLDSLAITAHGVKFLSESISAYEAAVLAEQIENAARRGDRNFVIEKMPHFLDYMENFVSMLKLFVEQALRHTRR